MDAEGAKSAIVFEHLVVTGDPRAAASAKHKTCGLLLQRQDADEPIQTFSSNPTGKSMQCENGAVGSDSASGARSMRRR
jgi:hypothetical protein